MFGGYDLLREFAYLLCFFVERLVLLGDSQGIILFELDVDIEALLLMLNLQVKAFHLRFVGIGLGHVGAGVVFAAPRGQQPVGEYVTHKADAQNADE